MKNDFENYTFKIISPFLGANELNDATHLHRIV